MKHPVTWFYILFGLFIAFLFIRSTELYKETADPSGYWTKIVNKRTELLNDYIADAKKCDAKLARFTQASSRDIWIKQKALEGRSPEEALGDYQIEVESLIEACRFGHEMVPEAAKDLEEAKAKVRQLKQSGRY